MKIKRECITVYLVKDKILYKYKLSIPQIDIVMHVT